MSTSATAAALVCAAALALSGGGACGASDGRANNAPNNAPNNAANRAENRTMNDNSRPAGAGADAPAGDPSPAAQSDAQLDLRASISRDGDSHFRIEYRITNRGAKPVLLVNRGDTEFGLGAGRVYVEPQEDGTVQFAQRGYLLPAEQGPGPTGAVYPGVSELGPGATASETLRVAAPKARQHPYARHYPQHPVPTPLRRARFCLGVVKGDAPTRTTRGTRVLSDFQSIASQQILCSQTEDLD